MAFTDFGTIHRIGLSMQGMNKRDLLRDLLPIISTNRALQRLVNQFGEALNEVSDKQPTEKQNGV